MPRSYQYSPEQRLRPVSAPKRPDRREPSFFEAAIRKQTWRNPNPYAGEAFFNLGLALELLDRAPVDADDPYALIADHIRQSGLKYETLLYFADRYYNRKTIIQLAHTAGRKEA